MKKLTIVFALLALTGMFMSCNNGESYADQLKRERAAIAQYIADSAVTVIDEDQFRLQNYTTDLKTNQFVRFNSNGVYMQIVRKGCGEKIKDGEMATVLCRFKERNLLTDSLQISSSWAIFSDYTNKMTVVNNSGTFTATFDASQSIMNLYYGSTSVPAGWLTPLAYVNVGRQSTPDGEIAYVRLIVPAAQGQAGASQSVYPCLYDLTYERGRE